MEITQIVGRIPTKRVTVRGVTTENHDEVITFAMTGARETRSSLFGVTVEDDFPLDPGVVVVVLHTD